MSEYNKNLPLPAEICWVNADRSIREQTITMPYGGVIPPLASYIGWLQTSFAYSYQIQYKVKARMTPDNQLETGADYTETDWKYMNASWVGDVDTMNRCVAPDLENKYFRYYNFSGKSLMTRGIYDKLELIVRVRSFNKKLKQHGAWVTQKLHVKCQPTVAVHKIVALADGGLQFYLNTNGWKRGDSQVVLKDIRHEGAAIFENKKTLYQEVGAIGTNEASGYPYAIFTGRGFNTGFRENEKIVLKDCFFRTVDGVNVSLDGTYTIDPVSSVIDEPVVTVTRDEDAGTISVTVQKSDAADNWGDVQTWLNCIVRGQTKRHDYVEVSGTKETALQFLFRPPLDCEMNLCIGISNDLRGKFSKIYTTSHKANLQPMPSNGRVMINYTDGIEKAVENGVFCGSKVVAMNYDTNYSTDAARQYEKELPHGRSRPVAFIGEGLEKSIDISGNIDGTETGEYTTCAYSSYQEWLDFQEQQGLVLARLPFGRTYTAICTQLTIDQEDEFDEGRNISMKIEEVDI